MPRGQSGAHPPGLLAQALLVHDVGRGAEAGRQLADPDAADGQLTAVRHARVLRVNRQDVLVLARRDGLHAAQLTPPCRGYPRAQEPVLVAAGAVRFWQVPVARVNAGPQAVPGGEPGQQVRQLAPLRRAERLGDGRLVRRRGLAEHSHRVAAGMTL